MNDDDLRRRLDDLAAHAPDGDELRRRWAAAAPTRRTRAVSRRVAPVAAVLAAAAVVAVAAVGLASRGGVPSTEPPQVAAPPSAADATPEDDARVAERDEAAAARVLGAPGVALREVGRGRVVVSVPDTWRWEAPRCDEPLHSGYFFSVGIFKACAVQRPPTITTVRIDSLAATGTTQDDPPVDASLDGVPYGQVRSTVDGVTQDVVVVPQEDVRLLVKGPAEAVDVVVGSLRLLPTDEVAVPQVTLGMRGGKKGYAAMPRPREMQERLTRVGLRAEVRTTGGATLAAYDEVRVSPAPGTVVPVGTVVRIELAGS
ncbi:hypothetical protein [Mumia quercus]|uniref:hypothetical protein n=1 Tax=Mumia quercus TaxID=2976125 RepID=UPI0021D14816|nr:hypothetical protein [Mumia quercus]